VIAGAANNQLAAERIAEQLASRSILWAPDFVTNSGGLINIAEELDGYDPATARRRVQRIGDTVREIFDRAAADGETPLAAAMALAQLRIAEAATVAETTATEIGTDVTQPDHPSA
jgi:glutamate dehydrogenase/leucine dehydrogenase